MSPIAIREIEYYDDSVILPTFRLRLLMIGVGLSLATGRWGAWVGLPSIGIFVIDLLILFSFFLIVVRDGIKLDFLSVALGIFLISQLVRNHEYPLIIRLRDLLPFIYLEMFLLIREHVSRIQIAYIYKILRVSTLFSLVWNLAVGVGLLAAIPSNSIAGVDIFSQRPDQSGFVACIGVIVWSLSLTNSPFERLMNFWILPLNLLSLLLQPGRAGLLALLVSLPLLAIRLKNSPKLSKKGLVLFIFTSILVIPFAAGLQAVLPGDSAIKKFGILDQNGAAQLLGNSTAYGRKMGQTTLIRWTIQEGKIIQGAGPGFEMLSQSGAIRWLSGNANVRYPHNWWVSLFSRYGIIGLALWIVCVIASVIGLRREPAGSQFLTFVVSIMAASTFGVIMEAPFGVIPFAFFTARLVK